ncbi:MAG: aldehyde dehydrogenase, partial [Neisseriaceae bacterium]|nr:aldehyde dehydrogenase [Neisseriaceae bacterium]
MSKEKVFEAAAAGSLWAGHLIPGYQGDASRRLDNRTPIDNSLIGYIDNGDAETVNQAVAVAKQTFADKTWSGRAPAE